MSEQVEAAVHAAVAERGPITFAEYMEIALYSPGGFYERPPIGAGDEDAFVTSPHVHPIFAELLAAGLREQWERLGRPAPFLLVEVAAGDGTLARRLLEHLGDLPLRYIAVERSVGARQRLAGIPGLRVARSLADLGRARDDGEVGGGVGPIAGAVVFANELLDNLPFRVVRMRDRGPVEIRITSSGDGRLSEFESSLDPKIAPFVPDDLTVGDETALPTGGMAFVGELAAVLARGTALLIDYGGITGPAGSVHGYIGQRVVEDVLARPGLTDVTAGVDFRALAVSAVGRGLLVQGAPSQRDALTALGWQEWMRSELTRQGELLNAGAGREAVGIWSDRRAAQLLVDPAGLGRLRWLTLAAGDAPPPPWLEERS